MPVKPLYAERLKDCCSGDSTLSNTVVEQLQKTVEEHTKKINELQSKLDNTVRKDRLVTVQSLENENLFQAISLEEKNNDSNN